MTAADPDAVLDGREGPVLIDEWQLVPEVLGAVKRLVDIRADPGRFILTGSTRADETAAGWPMTGRVIRVPMWGLCEREVVGLVDRPAFLDLAGEGRLGHLRPADGPDLRGYLELALRGGFPELLGLSVARRRAWLAGYVDQVVRRDASVAGEARDPVRLRRYLHAVAACTATTTSDKTLYDAARLNRTTARAYDTLLEHLLVIERLPAWSSNRLSRVAAASKLHLVDPAFVGPLLNVDDRGLLRDADLLGRVLETFVLAQIRAELAAQERPATLFHLRTAEGRQEIDLVAEFHDGGVVAMEVKATSAPKPEDARHLRWLRERIGDRLLASVVFHTGRIPFQRDGVHFLPIACLWSPLRS